MLHLFKSKPVLKDLIPFNHVDIHSHLIPGIDDGAKTFEETLKLTKALQGFGIAQFITTPHVIQHVWDNSADQIKSREATTVLELEKHQINTPFRAAAEYMLDDNFSQLFQSEQLLTLKKNYVLVEMSYINAPIQLYTFLFDLQVAGWRVAVGQKGCDRHMRPTRTTFERRFDTEKSSRIGQSVEIAFSLADDFRQFDEDDPRGWWQ